MRGSCRRSRAPNVKIAVSGRRLEEGDVTAVEQIKAPADEDSSEHRASITVRRQPAPRSEKLLSPYPSTAPLSTTGRIINHVTWRRTAIRDMHATVLARIEGSPPRGPAAGPGRGDRREPRMLSSLTGLVGSPTMDGRCQPSPDTDRSPLFRSSGATRRTRINHRDHHAERRAARGTRGVDRGRAARPSRGQARARGGRGQPRPGHARPARRDALVARATCSRSSRSSAAAHRWRRARSSRSRSAPTRSRAGCWWGRASTPRSS